mgnify:CR=1 FL=1
MFEDNNVDLFTRRRNMYKILKAEKLADKIYLMDVEAPRVARHCQPGQFVIVKMDDKGERIPLTICDYDREAGTITIVFQPVGASTTKMKELKAGDYFRDFTGPLGNASELVEEDIEELIRRAVYDQRGMGAYQAQIEPDALEFLADIAGGDARAALNAVELGVMTTQRSEDGKIHLTLEVAQECIQKRAVKYDKTGDNHYDTISAFIKSMRGSDPDAAVYYLARMLYAGESVTFIARRMMICASEDVGNADPTALQVAVSASLAAERVGMPEAQIILAQAAAYIACAPKSNAAVNAIASAMKTVEETGNLAIPVHLQDAHYKGAAKLGHGKDYKYAHDYPNHYVRQQYLPYELSGREFYQPGGMGYEVKIKEHMQRIRREAAKAEQKPQDGAEQ